MKSLTITIQQLPRGGYILEEGGRQEECFTSLREASAAAFACVDTAFRGADEEPSFEPMDMPTALTGTVLEPERSRFGGLLHLRKRV